MLRFVLLVAVIFTSTGTYAYSEKPEDFKRIRHEIIQSYLKRNSPCSWDYDWTTAIFLFGAVEDNSPPGPELKAAIDSATQCWRKSAPIVITNPDEAAMALAFSELARESSSEDFKIFINRTKEFFSSEARNSLGVIDHVGRRHRFAWFLPLTSTFVPSSLWADSMVMSVLTQFKIDKEKNSTSALDQAILFHEKLRSPTGLYKHAYYVESQRLAPTNGHWLRGNGWMVFGISELIRLSDPKSSQNRKLKLILRDQLLELKKYFHAEHGFKTLIDMNTTSNYFESSGLALITAAWANAISTEVLTDAESKKFLLELTRAAMSYVKRTKSETLVHDISGPTTAMRYSNYYTSFVGLRIHASYGVGAYLLMLKALERITPN